MEKLLRFIGSQKLLTIAAHDEKDVWVANVYYSIDDNGKIYFVSPTDSKHCEMIPKNPSVAFSIAWFDSKNSKNRKGVQGKGICRLSNIKETAVGASLLYKNFPDLRDIFTLEWITTNIWKTKVWIIVPSYIKYFDDEVYGDKESEEFNF